MNIMKCSDVSCSSAIGDLNHELASIKSFRLVIKIDVHGVKYNKLYKNL